MSEFDAPIAEKEKQLQAAIAHLEEISRDFVKEAIDAVAALWRELAKKEVQSEHEVTEGLSEAALKQLKIEVEELAAEASKHVSRFFETDLVWWHRQNELPVDMDRDKYDYFVHQNDIPRTLLRPFRFAIGCVVPILRKYGYMKPTRTGESAWTEYFPPQAVGSQRLPFYPLHLEGLPKLAGIAKQYDAAVREAERIVRERHNLLLKKRTVVAAKRWDDA